MRGIRLAVAAGLMVIPVLGAAYPTFVKDFAGAYAIPKGSKLATASCSACHVGATPKLNPYGQDLKAVMTKANTKKLTPQILARVAGLDSDKDGVKNGAEIKKGTLPGDPTSK